MLRVPNLKRMKVIRVTRSSLSSASYFHADGFSCLFSRSSPPFLPFACTSLIWNFEWKFRSFSFPESKGWNRLGFKFRCNEIQSDFLHVVFLFFMRISIYRGRESLYGIVIIVSLIYRFFNKYKYSFPPYIIFCGAYCYSFLRFDYNTRDMRCFFFLFVTLCF